MSMLANSERITVGWLARTPFLLDISPIERELPPSLMRHLSGYRIVAGLNVELSRPHTQVRSIKCGSGQEWCPMTSCKGALMVLGC